MLTILILAAALSGPIASSIERHAAEATVEDVSSDSASWTHFKRLASATDIVITTDTGDHLDRVFVSADDESVTVLNASTNPPCHAVKMLETVASQRPELFEPSHLAVGFIAADLDVRADRVLVKGQPDCPIDVLVQRVPRASIRSIKSPRRLESSKGWIVAGVTLGFIAGIYTAAAGSQIESCGYYERVAAGCYVPFSAPLWGPVAGGLLAHYTTRQPVEKTYYRRECDCD